MATTTRDMAATMRALAATICAMAGTMRAMAATTCATAVTMGDIPSATDIHALARFIQTVQTGMSILARDGAGRAELEAVADVAMAGWDQWVGR